MHSFKTCLVAGDGPIFASGSAKKIKNQCVFWLAVDPNNVSNANDGEALSEFLANHLNTSTRIVQVICKRIFHIPFVMSFAIHLIKLIHRIGAEKKSNIQAKKIRIV